MYLVTAEPLYDYDNPADQENYCPMIMVSVLSYCCIVMIFLLQDAGASGDSNDDDDDNAIEGTYCSTDTTAMPFVNNTQQLVLNDTCDVSTRMLIGDNLVAAPNKVKFCYEASRWLLSIHRFNRLR